jgi:superfamily II DNA/RNA helicase
MLFSATLDGEVNRIAKRHTDNPVRHEHVAPKSTVQVEHRFVGVTHEKRFDALVEELRADRELALIFVRTKRGADRLVKRLGSAGIKAVAMHGNKSQSQRERALAQFDSGKVDALVATDVAARGIDVDGISHVINFDPPRDVRIIAEALKLRREFAETGYAVSSSNRSSSSRSSRGRRRR